ncbi:MAG TPA: flagellar hook-basal body protein [Ignavibacteriaceae bacterium]|nr:flagellar hook-basal body protein [Ignavibacteriaceae bacterium]
MIKGIYLTGRSLDGKMKSMEVIANNLANINTTGFKREVPFAEIISNAGDIKIRQVTDFQEGTPAATSNTFDFYLSGKAFFAVKTDKGIQLTRNGRFSLSNDGFLVTEEGNKVLGKNGEINLSDLMLNKETEITVTKEGEIRAGDEILDRLLIVQMDDHSNLKKVNDTNFVYEDGNFQEADPSDYKVLQGYLEESNINPVIELENMIQTNADYEAGYKMMQSLDDSLGKANEIGKV